MAKAYEHGPVLSTIEALKAFDAMPLEFKWHRVKTSVDANNAEKQVAKLRKRLDSFEKAVSDVFETLNARVSDYKAMQRSLERQLLECTLRKATDQDRLVLRTLKSPAGGYAAGRALFDALADACNLPFPTLAEMAGHDIEPDSK